MMAVFTAMMVSRVPYVISKWGRVPTAELGPVYLAFLDKAERATDSVAPIRLLDVGEFADHHREFRRERLDFFQSRMRFTELCDVPRFATPQDGVLGNVGFRRLTPLGGLIAANFMFDAEVYADD